MRQALPSSTLRPGCYDQPRPVLGKSGYYALTRKYMPSGTYYLEDEWIPFRMTPECKNNMVEPMPGCNGCKNNQHEKT